MTADIKIGVKGVDYVGVSVCFFCHDGDGNFVMAKRSTNTRDEHGKWDIGSGGLEFEDSVIDTLVKEIKEEYCADVLEHEFLGYRDAMRTHNGVPTHWIGLDFKVLVDHAQVKNGEPHKFDAVEWFTLDTLPDELHSMLPLFFEQYQGRL